MSACGNERQRDKETVKIVGGIMSLGKMAIVGDGDSIMVFKAAGVSGRTCKTAVGVFKTFRRTALSCYIEHTVQKREHGTRNRAFEKRDGARARRGYFIQQLIF